MLESTYFLNLGGEKRVKEKKKKTLSTRELKEVFSSVAQSGPTL